MSAAQIKAQIKGLASDMAGGFPTAKKGHHYEVSVEGATVFVRLVLAPAAKQKNRARLRFRRLQQRLRAAGFKLEYYDDGSVGVSGSAKKAAAGTGKKAA